MPELSGEDYKELKEALVAAFPTASKLRQMLRFRRELNLDAITEEGALDDRVFEVIRQAEAEGWTLALVRDATAENPGNPRLAAITERLLSRAWAFLSERPWWGMGEAGAWRSRSRLRSSDGLRGTGPNRNLHGRG
jgi:Effector-associated domain 1